MHISSVKHRSPAEPAHHGDEAAYEAEVGEVVGVDGGGRVDLQAVVALAGVLKQAVHGVQHLVGQQEEPLPGRPPGGGDGVRGGGGGAQHPLSKKKKKKKLVCAAVTELILRSPDLPRP